MKRPSFIQGVFVAAILGFFASAAVATLTPFVGLGAVIRLVIPALGLAYLLYLFSRSTERLGRVTTLALWGVLAAITWWVSPPLPLYLLIHVGAVWLVRSLQRISCHLVLLPGAGAFCGNTANGAAQADAGGTAIRRRQLRQRTAPG
jgi:hypothetical protein